MSCPQCDSEEVLKTDEFEYRVFYECMDCGSAWSDLDGELEDVFHEDWQE